MYTVYSVGEVYPYCAIYTYTIIICIMYNIFITLYADNRIIPCYDRYMLFIL